MPHPCGQKEAARQENEEDAAIAEKGYEEEAQQAPNVQDEKDDKLVQCSLRTPGAAVSAMPGAVRARAPV